MIASMKKIALTGLLISLLVCFRVLTNANVKAAEIGTSSYDNSLTNEGNDAITYKEYIAAADEIYPEETIAIDVSAFDNEKSSGAHLTPSGAVETSEDSVVAWRFDVAAEGLYHLYINYYPSPGNGLSIQRRLLIDDETPFEEAEVLSFYRLWRDGSAIKTENGNEIRPMQVESPEWIDCYVADSTKINNGYFKFYLTEGSHTLTLAAIREPMEIKRLDFVPATPIPDYADKLKQWQSQGYEVITDAKFAKYQAESNAVKSSPSLFATSDNTSPLTENYNGEKNHLYKIRLNLAGGGNWSITGDFMEWEINVPREGLYALSFRYLQDMKSELPAVRCLYVNGEIPFSECLNIEFDYTTKFKMKTLGDADGDYLFHLKEGVNTIRLEVSLGKYAEAISEIKQIINRLNLLYREIIVITGTAPDMNIDYQLKRYIPDIVDRFEYEKEQIKKVLELVTDRAGKKVEETVPLIKLYDQLGEFSRNIYKVSLNLSLFSSNISALGTSLNNLMTQPLKLDFFGYHSPGSKLPKGKENFFQKIWFEIRRLIVSFFVDYDSLGSGTKGKENIEVWVLSGRDQTQVIKNLVASDFTPRKDIGVTLKVVPASALLPNTLVGRGPDAVLMIGNDMPAQYAFRNAAYDLSVFPDIEDVIGDNFHESALTNLRYNNGIYGLPETISFPILFYREDIIKDQLGLSVPDTWDELLDVMLALQNYNMDIYLGQPSNVNNTGIDALFASLLYQSGGKFYIDNGVETALRDETAIQTFIKWTEFYTQYGIPLQANFVNRFRSGDMPIGISDYSLYNTLTMSAPEISGKWKMALLPGTRKEDGEIDRSTISGGTACMIIKNTKRPDAAWEFLKWWVSTETQTAYGREIESVLGVSARYATANINSIKQLSWSAHESKVIQEQYSHIKGFEQVPGGYMTPRQLNYAFRRVVNDNANPRETLLEYALAINTELKIKRKEFGLE